MANLSYQYSEVHDLDQCLLTINKCQNSIAIATERFHEVGKEICLANLFIAPMHIRRSIWGKPELGYRAYLGVGVHEI